MFNVNQITSQLAKMPDPMLQKYAAMHKNDPYTVSLALAESNRRKAMRVSAQAKLAGVQQPTVVDQDIAEMAAVDPMGNVTGALPENLGIGKLPAPNMAPIGKAEGGIIGFKDKGAVESDPKQMFATEYRPIAESVGARLGIDPGILISQWGHESAWGKKTVGKYNFGNIKDVSGKGPRAYDKIEGSRSSYKSYESPEQFAEDYVKLIEKNFPKAINTGNNVLAFSEGLKEGVYGPYGTDKNYTEKLANTYTSLFPSAQAAPASFAQDAVSRIPTGGKPGAGPTPAVAKEVGFLSPEYMESKFGLSPNVARNVYNTMMAPTPLAPASTLPKTGGYFSKAYEGLAGLGEKVYNKLVPSGKLSEEGIAALQAKRAEEAAANLAPRLTPPSAPLPQGSPTIPVTQAGQGVVQTAEDLEKIRLANQAADRLAASQAAARAAQSVPSAAEKIQTASLLREADEAARLTQAARAATNTKTGLATTQIPGGVTDLLKEKPTDMGDLEATDRSLGQVQPTPEVKKIEEAAPVSDGKTTGGGGLASLFKDPAFFMAMRLLANKNPNLFGAVGEAGIGTVGDVAAAEKAASESEYRKALGKYYGAYGEAIERGAKEKNEVQLAEKSAQEALDTWAKNNKMALLQSPDLYDRMRDKYRRDAYNVYGIKMPTMAASSPDTTGGGFKLLGVRPG